MIDALVDHLKGHADAAILAVSSGTGFVPYPSAETHSASKAAVHSYLVLLRSLLKTSVQVIEIIPPAGSDRFDGWSERVAAECTARQVRG